MFGITDNLTKGLLKGFIPKIKSALKSPATKQKIIDFLNAKKNAIEPIDNEMDIVMVIGTGSKDMYFSLYTILDSETMVLSRNVGTLQYDELVEILDKLLTDFQK